MPNPLPPEIFALNFLTCQTVLREGDGVASAIRIVDVFYVPDLPTEVSPDALPTPMPIVQVQVLVMLKAEPGYEREHEIHLKLQKVDGEISDLTDPIKTAFVSRLGTEVPGGMTINAQLNLAVKRLGICYLLLYFDGELIGRTSITLLPKTSDDAKG